MRYAFLFLFLMACAQNPERPSAKTTAAPSKYSFEQLQQAAFYGTSLIVADVNAKFAKKKRKALLPCDPPVEKMNIWITQIKSMIDVQIPHEQREYLSSSASQRTMDAKFKSCEKQCLCGAYAEMIGGIEEKNLTAQDLELKDEMLKKHGSQTPAQEKNCLQQAKWFCESELLKDLH